jgi:phosphinothricin acetyltransferase
MIRQATPNDAKAILDVYNPYVETTTITFEEVPVTLEEMEARIAAKIEDSFPYFVYEEGGEIPG